MEFPLAYMYLALPDLDQSVNPPHRHHLALTLIRDRCFKFQRMVQSPLTIESFPDQKLASGHHGDSWTNRPAMRDDRVSPFSDH